MVAQRFLAWSKQTSSEARNVILGVIKSHNEPISTRDLFEKAVKVPAKPRASGEPLTRAALFLRSLNPGPSHPDHPIRSLNYLKRTVLEDLVRTRDIKKVHIKRVLSPEEIEQRRTKMSKAQLKKTSVAALEQPISTWMWQLVEKKRIEDDKGKGGEQQKEAVFGAEVGVGEDWGHLNRRRRRVREEKVERDVKWMRKLGRARTRQD